MDFTAILEYQRNDEKIQTRLNELSNDYAYSEYKTLDNKIKKEEAEIRDLAMAFMVVEKDFVKLQKEVNDLEIVLKETDEDVAKEISESTSIDNLKQNTSNALNNMVQTIAKLEAEAKKEKTEISKIKEKFDEKMRMRSNHKKTLAEKQAPYDQAKAKALSDIKVYQVAQAKLVESIDPETLENYKRLSNNGKVKVYYEMSSVDLQRKTCAKCYKIIDHAIDKLKNPGDAVDCPECGAILIKQ